MTKYDLQGMKIVLPLVDGTYGDFDSECHKYKKMIVARNNGKVLIECLHCEKSVWYWE